MKKVLVLVILCTSGYAFANDSGMPYIDVEDLTFKEAAVGTKITFKGKDAMSLFNALPSMSVMDNEHGFTARGQRRLFVFNALQRNTMRKRKEVFL